MPLTVVRHLQVSARPVANMTRSVHWADECGNSAIDGTPPLAMGASDAPHLLGTPPGVAVGQPPTASVELGNPHAFKDRNFGVKRHCAIDLRENPYTGDGAVHGEVTRSAPPRPSSAPIAAPPLSVARPSLAIKLEVKQDHHSMHMLLVKWNRDGSLCLVVLCMWPVLRCAPLACERVVGSWAPIHASDNTIG
jgi:hypothetical protein